MRDQIEFSIDGRAHTFDSEELSTTNPEDPAQIVALLNRLHGSYAFYAHAQARAKRELARLARAEVSTRAAFAREVAQRLQAEHGKKPPQTEIERTVVLDLSEGDETTGTLGEYRRIVASREEWEDLADRLKVIVDTVNIRCSTVREQASLVARMLANNIISPSSSGRPVRMGETGDTGFET